MAEPEAKRARPAALKARISTFAQPTLGDINALTVAIDGTLVGEKNSKTSRQFDG